MITTPEMMIDSLVDCTLATVESMVGKKSTPKGGEFERQCNIAQKGIDFLGKNYPFTSRASKFAKVETAFEYYTRQHLRSRGCPMVVDQKACIGIDNFMEVCEQNHGGLLWVLEECGYQSRKHQCWDRFDQSLAK